MRDRLKGVLLALCWVGVVAMQPGVSVAYAVYAIVAGVAICGSIALIPKQVTTTEQSQ